MVFFRSRHPGAEVFNVTTGYVPLPRDGGGEPYLQTFQWSRRFIGLKVFMALAELGRSPSMIPGRINRVASQVMQRLLPRRTAIELMGRASKSVGVE